MTDFLPEGKLLDTDDNKRILSSVSNMKEAQKENKILEAKDKGNQQ